MAQAAASFEDDSLSVSYHLPLNGVCCVELAALSTSLCFPLLQLCVLHLKTIMLSGYMYLAC